MHIDRARGVTVCINDLDTAISIEIKGTREGSDREPPLHRRIQVTDAFEGIVDRIERACEAGALSSNN